MNEGLIASICSKSGYIIVFLLFFVTSEDIRSWDLAVANEQGLHFFNLDKVLQYSINEIGNLDNFYALTYDSFYHSIFFSVNSSIFAYNLTEKTVMPLVQDKQHDVQGISIDRGTHTLFWTDGNGHTIWKMPLHNKSRPVEMFLTFKSDILTGVAISYCKRLLFWGNSNHRSASIDRSDLNGLNHKKIIDSDLFIPLGITVDEKYQKIYWTDDQSGIYYKIERSDFDGSNRELVVRGTHQEPFGITIISNTIYWSDTTQRYVFMLPLNASLANGTNSNLKPEIFYKFNEFAPRGIVSSHESSFDCSQIVVEPAGPAPAGPGSGPKEMNKTTRLEPVHCLNAGEEVDGECRCKSGFAGRRCELSECHNFCLNGGLCFLDSAGFAECRCLPGYRGSRCDIDLCTGFCLNGGRCSINSSVPVCSCGTTFTGQRCEIALDVSCPQICLNSNAENALCNCNLTSEYMVKSVPNSSPCQQQYVTIIFLVCFQALTMLVVMILVRKVCILRRRPRIKKRIIVNKGVRNQTAMTARPQIASSEQYEITIENCCNMNICETPCFEPNIRSSRTSTPSSKKTEDKKNLLKNMEDEFEGSDLLYS